ncbi:hypothetical protein CgunFtcFv8_025180 [Champsocephalus gunnari]|uniref:Uncharacterized protein n=1 Tax=Champsocephalus gunnari TaxID=52237 RepID=A0AAN8DGN3_CHAGU|nr:hypothetical protein CgunFtcFv8_025180 [Champsocephalus gunnari]
MEEGVLEEDPVSAMVFGNPKDEQRGRGMRRNRREQRAFGGEGGETVAMWRDMWGKREVKAIAVTRVDVDEGNWGW